MKTISPEIKEFLEERANRYNQPAFIETDPICIPHRFERKEDIEIAGFLTATIAWGSRATIIKNALKLMELMGNAPFDFVMSHREHQLERFGGFAHRTFNQTDLLYFIKALKYLYQKHGGLEPVFSEYATPLSTQPAIHEFRKIFLSQADPGRTSKHLSDPAKGSAAKRVNMFLRWMVRDDRRGVDFGLWKHIKPGQLSCPLDIHSGNAARKLELLTREQNDARALEELDKNLRLMDPLDPVKFDFALFGLGVFEKF